MLGRLVVGSLRHGGLVAKGKNSIHILVCYFIVYTDGMMQLAERTSGSTLSANIGGVRVSYLAIILVRVSASSNKRLGRYIMKR